MNCKHICGECKYHKHICNRTYDEIGYSREEWICNNKRADAYSLMTDYNDGCEEFEPRGVM